MTQQLLAQNKWATFDVSTFRPILDYVILKGVRRQKTAGGIWLSRNEATECWIGECVRHSGGIPNPCGGAPFPMEIEPGELCLVMRYSGVTFDQDSIEYRLMHEEGIWAKVKFKDRESYELSEVQPRFNCVLLEPVEEKKFGSIWLANENMKENELRLAKVVAVGPGQWIARTGKRIPPSWEVGQTVYFQRYAGAEMLVNGKWMRLVQSNEVGQMRMQDIKCVVEETA